MRSECAAPMWDDFPLNKLELTHLSFSNILYPASYFIVTDTAKTINEAWWRVLLEKLIVI
jgi:hypothetical protein